MSYSDRRSNRTSNANPVHNKRSGLPGERVLSSIILGIFLLIAASLLGGKLDTLNKTINDKNFSDTNSFSSPADITATDKMYYNVDDAAAYLSIGADEVVTLITSGEIDEYIKTDDGYVIAKTVLDAWFDNAAYQTKIGNENTGGDSD